MKGSIARAAVGLLAGFVLAAPGAAHSAIKSPSCSDLIAWTEKFDARDRVILSRTNNALWLHRLLLADDTERLFGLHALDWSAEDLAAADARLAACAEEARRSGPARNFDDRTLEAYRAAAVKQHGAALQAAALADRRTADALAALLALPPSRDLLRALAAISKAQGRIEELASFNPELATLPNGPAQQRAGALWVALRDGSARSGGRMFPPLLQSFVELRRSLLAEATAELAAQPASLDGLKALKTALARSREEFGQALAEEDLAGLDAAAADRRDVIEEELLAGEAVKVAAATVDLNGLQTLLDIKEGPIIVVLSRERYAALNRFVASRQDAIINGIVDAKIAGLAAFPPSVAGIRALEAYRVETVAVLEGLIRPRFTSRFIRSWIVRQATLSGMFVDGQLVDLDRFPSTLDGLRAIARYRAEVFPPLVPDIAVPDAERLADALRARAASAAAAALPEFRDSLAGLAAGERGIADLASTLASIEPALSLVPDPLRAQYAVLARERRAALGAGAP